MKKNVKLVLIELIGLILVGVCMIFIGVGNNTLFFRVLLIMLILLVMNYNLILIIYFLMKYLKGKK